MELSQNFKVTLIKIRLMADITRAAQCKTDEYDLVMEMISDLADRVLDEEETPSVPFTVYDDEE